MLAENLKKMRIKYGLTQQELTDILGISQTAVNFFELGKKIPSVAITEQIADVYHCSVDYLLGRVSGLETN